MMVQLPHPSGLRTPLGIIILYGWYGPQVWLILNPHDMNQLFVRIGIIFGTIFGATIWTGLALYGYLVDWNGFVILVVAITSTSYLGLLFGMFVRLKEMITDEIEQTYWESFWWIETRITKS